MTPRVPSQSISDTIIDMSCLFYIIFPYEMFSKFVFKVTAWVGCNTNYNSHRSVTFIFFQENKLPSI